MTDETKTRTVVCKDFIEHPVGLFFFFFPANSPHPNYCYRSIQLGS